MSLSDVDNDQFEPLAVESLESFNEELSNKTEESDPDFDRFKALFEKPKFEAEESYEFKAMYDAKKEEEEIVFTPLIKGKDEPNKKEKTGQEIKEPDHQASSEKRMPEEPGKTPEEKGYQEGFERGLEEGIAQGQKQGFESGFKKGEAEGAQKGEQQGLELGKQQGIEQGLKEGEENGRAEARKAAVEIINALEASLKSADQTLDLLVEKYEERIISLIQQIAGKVVAAHIEMNDDLVKQMILEALKTLVQPEDIVLSVSSDSYDYIEMVKDEFFEQIDSLNNVSLRSDPSVKKGGCKIETATATVSTDIDSRLDAIFEAIKRAGIA